WSVLAPKRSPAALPALLIAACLTTAACWDHTPPAMPLPPAPVAAPAPAAIAGLTIYVHQLLSPVENDDDRYDYTHTPGFTNELRTAVGVALAEAGYKVSLERHTQADLTALVFEQWEPVYDDERVSPEGLATLALRDAHGTVIDRFSAPVPVVGRGTAGQLFQ